MFWVLDRSNLSTNPIRSLKESRSRASKIQYHHSTCFSRNPPFNILLHTGTLSLSTLFVLLFFRAGDPSAILDSALEPDNQSLSSGADRPDELDGPDTVPESTQTHPTGSNPPPNTHARTHTQDTLWIWIIYPKVNTIKENTLTDWCLALKHVYIIFYHLDSLHIRPILHSIKENYPAEILANRWYAVMVKIMPFRGWDSDESPATLLHLHIQWMDPH